MNKNGGFMQLIIILALLVIILSLLGVSLGSLFKNKLLQENFSFIFDGLRVLWNKWLGEPITAVWDFVYKFFIDFVWNAFLDAMNAIKGGRNPILNQ